jgi:aminoglycoside phosphotransferase (APT) family kinase protein
MDTAALEAVVRRFFLFDTWHGAEPVGSGHINDTYRVTLGRQGRQESYLLQRLNHHIFTQPERVMNNMAVIARYLETTAYPLQIPAPLPALDGAWLHRDALGNYWRMLPYYADTYVPEGQTDTATAQAAAQAYGAFARALHEFPAEQLADTIPGFHDTNRRWRVFEQALAADPCGRATALEPEIAAMHRMKPLFDTISELKRSGELPLRVTHNDTKAGNVLFSQHSGQPVAVIDWDTVMPGTILSDFGDMIRTFVPNAPEDAPTAGLSLHLDILDALKTGFLSPMAEVLSAAEQAYLLSGGAWITGEQALRFLTDYLAGDTYYKIKYPEHNLVRARNQIALYGLLEGLG